MADNVAGAAICGGATCCILVCLFVIGIPMFIAGISLLTMFDDNELEEGPREAGIVLLIIASLVIFAGIITGVFTFVFASRMNTSRAPQSGYVVTTGNAEMGSPTHQVVYPAAGTQQQVFYPAGAPQQQYLQQQHYPAAQPIGPPPYADAHLHHQPLPTKQ